MALLRTVVALASVQQNFAAIPPELADCKSIDCVYDRVESSEDLQKDLPVPLRGDNFTKANLQKWLTVTRHSAPILPVGGDASQVSLKTKSGVDPGTVIALGKLAWTIVKGGSPTINISADYTAAVPDGVTTWTDLANFQNTGINGRYVYWKNLFGSKVCNFEWNWEWACNGNYQGIGQYITQATEGVTSASDGWGSSLDAGSATSDPANVGSQSQPNAQIKVHASVTCGNFLNKDSYGETATMKGDCSGTCGSVQVTGESMLV